MVLLAVLVVAIGSLVAAIAVPCAKLAALTIYLRIIAVVVFLAIAVFVLAGLSVPPHRIRPQLVLLYGAVFVPLGILYSLTPGLLVKRAAPARSILIATGVTSAVGIPIWFYYTLLIVCWRGDC